MGTTSSKLIPVSRSLLGKTELLQNLRMREILWELLPYQMNKMWETQAMSISSTRRIVPDNREQSYKVTWEIGQKVRHKHGRGDAGEFGGSLGGGVAGGGSSSGNGDDENASNENQQKLLRRYIIDVDIELSHMTKKLKFVRQRTHLLVNLFGKHSPTTDVILEYLNHVQNGVQRIEVILCLIQEFPENSIEESLFYIEEYLRCIDSDLVVIHKNIKRYQSDNIGNKEQEEKRQNILIKLKENVTQLHYTVVRIQEWSAKI